MSVKFILACINILHYIFWRFGLLSVGAKISTLHHCITIVWSLFELFVLSFNLVIHQPIPFIYYLSFDEMGLSSNNKAVLNIIFPNPNNDAIWKVQSITRQTDYELYKGVRLFIWNLKTAPANLMINCDWVDGSSTIPQYQPLPVAGLSDMLNWHQELHLKPGKIVDRFINIKMVNPGKIWVECNWTSILKHS